MGSGFTFAVMGHNEEARLHLVLGQALEAAGAGDRVWFVDSASTDSSAARAAALGAEVVTAPLGKGRAMAVAIECCRTEFICFIDGDLDESDHNIAAALRGGVEATDADMLVGRYTEAHVRRLLAPGIYWPMVEALLPDASVPMDRPLTGQRVIRTGLSLGDIPPDWGVETHLNLHVALIGGKIVDWPIGRFQSPLRDLPTILPLAADIGHAILDLAETWSRLDPGQRSVWEAWIQNILDAMDICARAGAPDETFVEHMTAIPIPIPAPNRR